MCVLYCAAQLIQPNSEKDVPSFVVFTPHDRYCARYLVKDALHDIGCWLGSDWRNGFAHHFIASGFVTETGCRSWCWCRQCWIMSCKAKARETTHGVLMKSKTNCWNEAAVVAGCDPNTDDDCLCGPFFDAVTSCTAATCSIGENLGMSCPISQW